MEDKTVKQEPSTNNDGGTPEKTFTQAELDAVVQDRLDREKKKIAEYGDLDELKRKAEQFDKIEEESKSELEKANEKAASLQAKLDQLERENQVKTIREEVSKETGVPAHLLTADTKEACEEQAKDIMSFAKPASYPSVPDGGEVGGTGKRSTEEQFAEWAEKQLK